MLDLLRTRRLRRFFLAHLQSQIGTGAAYVALVLIAYHRLHQGWGIALVLLADVLPGIVLAAPLGALADRLPRTRLAVGADLLRAAAFLSLALVSSFGATVGLALAAGVGTALFRPTIGASLPDLVPAEQRSPATALYGTIMNLGITVGPALTALAMLVTTPEVVLAANGATFLVSAALLARVPLGGGAAGAERDTGDGDASEGEAGVWTATRQGLRAARGIPGVAPLLLIGGASLFAGAMMNVAEPVLATGPLHAGRAGYSILVAVYGTGMIAGSLLCARVRGGTRGLRWLWLGGNALCALGMLGTALAPSLAWAIGTFAITGAANSAICFPEIRLFQETVPGALMGRVMGLRDVSGNVALLAAFVAAGAVLAPLGTRGTFAAGGAAVLALTVIAGVWLRDRAPRPEPSAVLAETAVGV